MVINLKKFLSEAETRLLFNRVADMSDYEIYGIKPFQSGVHISGEINKKPGYLSLDMDISAKLDTLCASCGKEITKQLNIKTHHLLVAQADPDDDLYIAYSDDKVDIGRVVNDALILNMEMRPLCKEDCKGFCGLCGVDLNISPCRCKKPLNPAFEKIKDKFKT